MMCLAGFSLMYIFSYICAKTDSVFLLALCSIFMGFLRMVLMMVNLFTLISCLLALLLPSYIISSIHPARSIRFE